MKPSSTAAKREPRKGKQTPAAASDKKSDAKDSAAPQSSSTGAAPAAAGQPAKPATASDGGKADGKEAAGKPATVKVKKRLLKTEVTLEGVFESQRMAEVALHAEEWNEFEVVKAIEHGARVKQGDVLVSLKTEKLDKLLADLDRDLSLARMSIREAELQVETLKRTTPLDLASSERSKRIADEDLNRFLKVDRPWNEKSIEFMVKTAENYLAYEKEELRQLEKMYKADDLVEDTEEIIVKRARDSVDRAQFTLDRSKVDRDMVLGSTLPRSEESMKLQAQRQAIDLDKARITLPAAQQRAAIALDKLKVELDRNEDRRKRLIADRQHMILHAPSDGIVYYGRCVRGKWVGGDLVGEKLRRGGRISNEEIVMTVVEPRPLFVRTSVPERSLPNVAAGMKGTAQPAACQDVRLTAIVQQVGAVPLPSREYDATVTVAMDEAAKAVMPGMSCELKIVAYQRPDALCIPPASLGAEESDPQKRFVFVVGKDGKPEKREVTVGRRAEKLVEILKGLNEGDEVLAELPKDKD